LTTSDGLDAPPATYSISIKHAGPWAVPAICRVNRIHGETRIWLHHRLPGSFKKLEKAVTDYTSGAFEGFDREDVLGLLQDRIEKADMIWRKPSKSSGPFVSGRTPEDSAAHIRFFCGDVENLTL